MLRVAIADVDKVTVVRVDGLTMVYRPAVADREDLVRQSAALLTPREVASARCATHVRELADYARTTPVVACPCYVPGALRAVGDWTCPLHTEQVAPAVSWPRLRLLAMRVERMNAISPIGTHGGFRVAAMGLIVALIAARGSLSLSLSLSLRGLT